MNPSPISPSTISPSTISRAASAPPPEGRPPAASGEPAGSSGGAASGLGTELRESLLLLAFAVTTTVGLTAAAQAALAALG